MADVGKRHLLLKPILCRVWVLDDHVCALMLRASYFVVMHEGIAKDSVAEIPRGQLLPFLQKESGNSP